MVKTAEFIEETKAARGTDKSPSETPPKKDRPAYQRGLCAPWPKGVSGNPGGRPKKDMAKEICQAIFEGNAEEIYKAGVKALRKGNAYAFDVYANRAYGKLKEQKEVTHIYSDVSDSDLNERIEQLERDLGLARAIDEAGRAGIAQAGTSKTNGHAKDIDVLSR